MTGITPTSGAGFNAIFKRNKGAFGFTAMDKGSLNDIFSTSRKGEMKITNEATLWRRAWVDSAVEAVRARLSPVSLPPADQPPAPQETPKPSLYIAWSRNWTDSE